MKNVIALFSDHKDAEKAIKKLDESGVDGGSSTLHSQHTIESSTNVRPIASANAAVSGASTPPAPVPGAASGGAVLTDDTIESYLANIGIMGDELSYYKHGIREGGHIVVVAVDKDKVDQARRVLTEAGGRAPQVE